jgi:thymidine kinase
MWHTARVLLTVGHLLCARGTEIARPPSGAKLYFRHGAVGSAKTLSLLAVAHTYEAQGKTVIVIKPEMDRRFGTTTVASRAGLSREADLLVTAKTDLPDVFDGCDCVLVDEAQFLSAHVIDQLRDLATRRGIPVICYGLRTDFRSELFDGSRRLFELAGGRAFLAQDAVLSGPTGHRSLVKLGKAP